MKLSHVLRYALPVGVMVLSWTTKALRDGKISREEVGELIEAVGELIGEDMTVGDTPVDTPSVIGTRPHG